MVGGPMGQPRGRTQGPTAGRSSRCHVSTCLYCLKALAHPITVARFPSEMLTGPCHPAGKPGPHILWPMRSVCLIIENVPDMYWLHSLASLNFGFTFPPKESYSGKGRQSCPSLSSTQHHFLHLNHNILFFQQTHSAQRC